VERLFFLRQAKPFARRDRATTHVRVRVVSSAEALERRFTDDSDWNGLSPPARVVLQSSPSRFPSLVFVARAFHRCRVAARLIFLYR